MNSTTEAVSAPTDDVRLDNDSSPSTHTTVDGSYAKYVLGILVLMGVFNFIDRQIFAILAEDIKADLSLSDSDLGFLFGTAFAVLYAVFGVPLGRLADSWKRTKQISLSLGFWSLMTALSGMTRSFLPLAACRFGVGIGEAGASPASLSLLYDYFSPKVRTTVLGIYASGPIIGAGLGLFLGGSILGAWNNAWPDPSLAPFGLKGWQAAFMVVGLPGLLLALLVSTLKEPVRGQAESSGATVKESPKTVPSAVHPLRILLLEILPMVPGVNLWLLRQKGAGVNVLMLNIGVGLGIALLAFLLTQATGDTLQWLAMGIGLYSVFSWGQALLCQDSVCFGLIFHCKTVRYVYLYIGFQTFVASAIGFWMIPWFQRHFGVSVAELGTVVGLTSVGAGLIGVIMGGVVADRLRQHTQRGKLYVTLVAAVLWLLVTGCMLSSEWILSAYIFAGFHVFAGALGAAPAVSTVNDLMIPRVRAIAIALYIMITSFMGAAMGPYCVGLLSDSLTAAGAENSEALHYSMFLSLVIMGVSIAFLLLAIKHLPADEDSRLTRARALGEDV